MRFRDRFDAGRRLAAELTAYAGRPDVLVLAIPRGGVVVGYEVARLLRVPLDVFIVRKIGAEHIPELAVGALASGGVQLIDESIVRAVHMSHEALDRIIAGERAELERRESAYRGVHAPSLIEGKVVLLVDDGVATGASMRVAIAALRRHVPTQIVVAVPVVDVSVVPILAAEADHFVAVSTPSHLGAVGEWYGNFDQTTDEEVIELLRRADRASRAAD
ncbi:MAG: phosphoribosyltransferase [Acidobacteriota bacterium]